MPDGRTKVARRIQDMGPRFYGKYRGKVVDNQDKAFRGRLKVSVPGVMYEETLWALPCVPYAAKGVGFFAMPPVGALVWVEFEGGNPCYPIWAGCFWAKGDLLPTQAVPSNKFFTTDKSFYEVDDRLGKISVGTSATSKIEIDKIKIRIQSSRVWSTTGKNSTNLTAIAFDVNKIGRAHV